MYVHKLRKENILWRTYQKKKHNLKVEMYVWGNPRERERDRSVMKMETAGRKSGEVSSGRFSVLMVREKVTICLYLSPWSHSSPFVPIPYRYSETRARVNTIFCAYTLLTMLINSELSLFSFKCLFYFMGSTQDQSYV